MTPWVLERLIRLCSPTSGHPDLWSPQLGELRAVAQRQLMCRRVILGTWWSRKERDPCLLHQSHHPYASLWIHHGPHHCRGRWIGQCDSPPPSRESLRLFPAFIPVFPWCAHVRGSGQISWGWADSDPETRDQLWLWEPRIQQLSRHEVCLTLATLSTLPVCHSL